MIRPSTVSSRNCCGMRATAARAKAAFLIRDARGATFFLRWRGNGELNRAEWDRPLPAGTVAIIHTHPNWLPLPSNRDIRVARQASVPVYVITPGGLRKSTNALYDITRWARESTNAL